jgi:hypothetical protein
MRKTNAELQKEIDELKAKQNKPEFEESQKQNSKLEARLDAIEKKIAQPETRPEFTDEPTALYNSIKIPPDEGIMTMSLVPLLNIHSARDYKTPGRNFHYQNKGDRLIIPYAEIEKLVEVGSPGRSFLDRGFWVVLDSRVIKKFSLESNVSLDQINLIVDNPNTPDSDRIALFSALPGTLQDRVKIDIIEKLSIDQNFYTEKFVKKLSDMTNTDIETKVLDLINYTKMVEEAKKDMQSYETEVQEKIRVGRETGVYGNNG